MILAVLLILLAEPAAAHGTLPGGTGFQAGFLHPLVATEHLVALITAGLALGRAQEGAIPPGLAGLCAGMAAGLAGLLPPAAAAPVVLAAAMALGLLLASGLRPGAFILVPVLLVLGMAIAADTDIPETDGAAAMAGLGVAGGLLLLNMAALSQWAGGRWPVLPRIAGSWAFAIALLVTTLRFALPHGPLAALP